MIKKIIKILFIVLVFSLFVLPVSAERYVNYILREGRIAVDSVFTPTITPVDNVNVIGFVCDDSKCDNVKSTKLWGGQVLNSGDDKIQLTYPTQLQSPYGYAIFYYKEGYIPWETHAMWGGPDDPRDPQGPIYNYLSKKENCHSPIENLNVVNEVQPNIPLVVGVDVGIDATTYSALQRAGPIGYEPPQLESHFSVQTRVTLRIYDYNNVLVDEQIKDITIIHSGSERVEFEWVPTKAGKHKIIVTTDVIDTKCSSSMEESASKLVHVLSDNPRNMCYTILNDLATSNPFPIQGELLTITTEKISNHADDNYIFTPVPTDADLTITRQVDGAIVNYQSLSLGANPDNFYPVEFGFNWDTTLQSGFYNISIIGIANSPLCDGLKNLPETISVTRRVSNNPEIKPTATVTADPTSGTEPLTVYFTCSATGGIEPYTYSWNFGDGETTADQNPAHTYDNDGVYTAECKVTDIDGDYDSDFVVINVEEAPPVCADKDVDGYGDPVSISCTYPDLDCDDNNEYINPGATEMCNGVDDNCNELIDEDFTNLGGSCSVGLGECQATGVFVCTADGTGTQCNAVAGDPTTEICDGLDNDCDGQTDEGDVCMPECTDQDEDGFNVEGGDCGPIDCDDENAYLHETLTCSYNNIQCGTYSLCIASCPVPPSEICDGLDNDCDGQTDEGDVCDIDLSAKIIADKTSGKATLEVNFDADVTGGNEPFAYEWDFNDDGFVDSIKKSVKAIFKAGSYLVKLTVIDFDGDMATDTITIDVDKADKKQVKLPRRKIHINQINIVNDELRAGEDLVVYVNFENQGNYKINDATVTIIVPELALRQKIGHIDLKTNKGVAKKFILEIPEDAEPGIYEVMIIIYDNGLRRVRYRPIEIIS